MFKIKYLGVFLFTFLLINDLRAQFSLKSEYRFNPVYSRGFRAQFTDDDLPGAYVHQRSRLIAEFKRENDLEINFTAQDWRVWGDKKVRHDDAELNLFRGYIRKWITPQLSIKAGRQGLIYDDQYLLGGLNWGGKMAHDAGVIMYEDSTFQAHAILAYNANGWDYNRDVYDYNFYKNMQAIWLHKDWSKTKLSFYAINRGIENPADTTIAYNLTVGPHLTFKLNDKIKLKGMYFHQIGKDTSGRNINANFFSIQASYQASQKVGVTLGLDRGSGTDAGDYGDDSKDIKTFDRMYGLIHGHYGYLDYFYRSFNVPGTSDSYLKFKVKANKKWSFDEHIHAFWNSADVFDPEDNATVIDPFLGIENDLKINYKASSDVKITFGHSIFFGTESLDKTVFGGGNSKDNQYAYFVVTINPTLFQSAH